MACEEYEIERHPLSGRRPMPTLPRRDFLVRQAVLNAAAELFPETVKAGALPRELRRYVTVVGGDWPGCSMLFQAIPRHFRILVEGYGGTTCPSS